MTLVAGRAQAPDAEAVHRRAADLRAAIELGGAQLDPAAVLDASAVVAKVEERSALAGSHTVVALAGATGSGKSSLFNAIAGQPLATIGARRPTTSTPTAAVWGTEPAGALLDWLSVARRHVLEADGSGGTPTADRAHDASEATEGEGSDTQGGDREAEASGHPGDGQDAVPGTGQPDLDGLVLLDLPDFDSREVSHRVEAERVLALCDVFVWVADPEKYADALLHDEYVRGLAGHAAVMIVVLNQSDRLSPQAVEECREDLARLFAADGAVDVPVLATSAQTGDGVAALKDLLAEAVAGHHAAFERLAADVSATAGRLRGGVADGEASVGSGEEGLVDALSRAAGVPVVLDAVEQDYLREAQSRVGWVFTRWGRQLTPDPLRRLRLDKSPSAVLGTVDPLDVRHVLGRSSIPAPSHAARSAVRLASLRLTDRAAEGLPVLWAEAVADVASGPDERLYEALDQAVVRTPLRGNAPGWWRLLGWLQWLCGAAVVVGFVWLVLLAVVGWLRLPDVPTPTLGSMPWPTLLFLVGLVVGLLAAWAGRAVARRGARGRRDLVAGRLRESVTAVAEEQLVQPVAAVLDRHRGTRELLDAAAPTG